MSEDSPLDDARQALALDTRGLAHPRNHSRLWHAREEFGEAVRRVAEHYSVSDAEAVMLLAQVLQEYAARMGSTDIADSR
jgi:hypothetical protein